MIFITLSKFRKKPTKEMTTEVTKIVQSMAEMGVKIHGFYWTLGRYDTVVIMEAPNEETAMKANIRVSDIVSTETMVAVSRRSYTTGRLIKNNI
ncbi:MAG TPA: GYD domain-containing protein [Candidatus Binatia bacterium]|nr:GYD domain-containing protein [Candidatus Binatia bacterium]